MKVTGIIAEYDPFHSGHLYQMTQARERTGADALVVVLGGDFLQRGTPSLTAKRARARMAVEAGADLVLALPYLYSVNSAREYARGAVRILAGTGCVDSLSFGCESGNLQDLQRAASVMSREDLLSPEIQKHLSCGLSYPESLTRAVEQAGGPEAAEVLRHPNNLLGCEYIRCVEEAGASMTVVPIRRAERSSEEDQTYESSGKDRHPAEIVSASEIRRRIREQGTEAAEGTVPLPTMKILRQSFRDMTPKACFEKMDRRWLSLLRYRGLTSDRSELAAIYSVGEGIEKRLMEAAADTSIQSVAELADFIKTKRYTRARIMRMLIHVLMNFKAEDFELLRDTCCIRVLAFSQQGRAVLSRMKKTASVPVLSNLARTGRYDDRIRRLLELEVRAAGMYHFLQGGTDLTGGEIRYVPYRKAENGSV